MLEAALKYAARGLAVQPLQDRGKLPITAHGCKDATTDESQIRQWWADSPGANIGIAPDNTIFVIDLDGAAPVAWYNALNLPDTYTVSTGKGYHCYWRKPADVVVKNRNSALAPGVDVKTAGGYVVAPPSIHPSGAVYEVAIDAPVADAPAALLGLVAAPVAAATPAARKGTVTPSARKMARQKLDEWKAVVEAADTTPGKPGNRHWYNDLVFELGTFCPHILPSVEKAVIDGTNAWKDRQSKEHPHTLDPVSRDELLGRVRKALQDGQSAPWYPPAPAEVDPAADWQHELLVNEEGNPIACQANFNTIVRRHPKIDLRRNERSGDIWLWEPPPWDAAGSYPRKLRADGTDATAAVNWLAQGFGFIQAGSARIWESMQLASHDKTFEPVREIFDALPAWDGIGRADTVFVDHMGADATPYTRIVTGKTLIGLMARTYKPGCKMDNMLVLQGRQGLGKTLFWMHLVHPEAYSSDLNGDPREVVMRLACVAIAEDGELAAHKSGRESDQRKAFLTRQVDLVRRPYDRAQSEIPRRWVAVGTVNEDTYLTDTTGNRRYWPVRVTRRLDVAAFVQIRDQILAEAKHRFEAGETWYLDESQEIQASQEQEAARENDPWEDTLQAKLQEIKAGGSNSFGQQYAPEQFYASGVLRYLTATQAIALVGGDASRHGRKISQALRAIGWRLQGQVRLGGARVRVYEAAPRFETTVLELRATRPEAMQ